MKNISQLKTKLLNCGLIPIVRGNYSLNQAIAIAETLCEAQIPVLEVTLNSADAFNIISELRKRLGDSASIGAGTVRTKSNFERAIQSGAQFTIAPTLDAETVQAANQADILHLPGVLTPTEVQHAAVLGCTMVKLFPIDTFGPKYLKALRAPLNDIEFVPTGGVTLDNLPDFVKAGAVAVGVGTALVRSPEQTTDELLKQAKAFRAAWDNTKAR